ncbi:hypothetical protein PoB_001561600 [Plakobranchus ocellatus]|uniref:Uncharacterized protein n=1 Tax=Plakobranchus ocellatus TaxID=259542 RepID=A0AAV3Z3F5_9GAST|nr:hypothetical protein PoB_001561600 [Plakobranchus ocellatus]
MDVYIWILYVAINPTKRVCIVDDGRRREEIEPKKDFDLRETGVVIVNNCRAIVEALRKSGKVGMGEAVRLVDTSQAVERVKDVVQSLPSHVGVSGNEMH